MVSKKGQNRDNSKHNLITKYEKDNKICSDFSYNHFHISKVFCKVFTVKDLFTDHLNHKIVNKATCRTFSANLSANHQLCVHWFKSFSTAIVFLRFSGFSDLFGKVFLITFGFSLLDLSTSFFKNNVNKAV